jgi:hypothetical protein
MPLGAERPRWVRGAEKTVPLCPTSWGGEGGFPFGSGGGDGAGTEAAWIAVSGSALVVMTRHCLVADRQDIQTPEGLGSRSKLSGRVQDFNP